MKKHMRTMPSFWYIVKQRLHGRNFLYEFYFRGKKTLDIGCGEGEFLKFDKELIHGLDTNTRAVERLSREEYKVKLLDAKQMPSSMPYVDGEFERVHSRNVIEHLGIEAAYGMIKEGARVLVPGGLFVLSSETATKKFWNTFGHVKPYPPEAILKLLRKESREEFETIKELEYAGVFYFGEYFKNKFLYLLSAFLGYYTPFLRREYFLVLRRK